MFLFRLNSSSWVNGHLYNFIKPSVAAGSYHDNYLSLEYTRKGWLPISKVDKVTVGIRKVLPLAPSVISTNVPHPTRDLMVITIGEDVVLKATVQIPVSTNTNFTLELSGIGFEAVAGQIMRVGRNIESLQRQIEGACKFKVLIIIKNYFF